MKYSLCKNCGCGDEGCEVDLIVQAEREACAKMADERAAGLVTWSEYAQGQLEGLAEDIRARNKRQKGPQP